MNRCGLTTPSITSTWYVTTLFLRLQLGEESDRQCVERAAVRFYWMSFDTYFLSRVTMQGV